MRKMLIVAACLAGIASGAHAQITTTPSSSANDLASALAGPGFNLTGSSLTTNTQNGFFNNGLAGVGINSGVVLTTGTLGCVGPSNTSTGCTGSGNGTTLGLEFTLDTSSLFFNYVFGSEEYNEFVGSSFNDLFTLVLDGPGFSNVNLAQIPGGGGVVSINNVNNGSNSAFFRDNTGGAFPIELDGLTTVLTASAMGLTPGATYTLAFNIFDVGDSSLDSAVFIQAGSLGTQNPSAVPEPSTWAFMIAGFGAIGLSLRSARRKHGNALTA